MSEAKATVLMTGGPTFPEYAPRYFVGYYDADLYFVVVAKLGKREAFREMKRHNSCNDEHFYLVRTTPPSEKEQEDHVSE